MSNQGIANRLNAKKVPSPAARKLQSGAKLSLHFRKSDEPPWSAKAVDRILHNEVYIGKLVQGKTRRLDYRSKKKMNVPMRDWVIVDNTHEAIIPAEQFELVQRILERKNCMGITQRKRMEQIQRLRTEKDQIFQPVKKDTDSLQAVMNTVGEVGDVMHLSQNVVGTFIDRIEVFNDERVKIRFTFEDTLKSYETG